MAISTLDAEILQEKYVGVGILDLWDELDSIRMHFNIAFELADPEAKDYFDEMHFLIGAIKARPLQERRDMLDFFDDHYRKNLQYNDFEAAEHFKKAAEEVRGEYLWDS